MKSSIAWLILLSISISPYGEQKNSIEVNLKLRVIESRKVGKILALQIKLYNASDKKFYLEGGAPLISSLRIVKSEGESDIDITENWLTDELYYVENNSLYIDLSTGIQRTFITDLATDNLNDPRASKFYETLISKKDKILSPQDKHSIKKWVQSRFERILFLEPHDSVMELQSLNTLGSGLYKLIFNYNGESKVYYVEKNVGSDIKLPLELSSYSRWQGCLKSDTLTLWVK